MSYQKWLAEKKLSLVLQYAFDFCFALFLTLILSPLFLVLCVLGWLFQGRPLFFRQRRPGRNGKVFILYKFRTMKLECNQNNPHSLDRVTFWGAFLRKSSLDELPQLINILKGDMSFVGPRPLLEQYMNLYSERQKMRHWVRPGITGWAQVFGRNTISWEKKFELDCYYVEKFSFAKYFFILYKTIFVIFNSSANNASSSITMEEFKGNETN